MDRYAVKYDVTRSCKDQNGLRWLGGSIVVDANDKREARAKAMEELVRTNASSIIKGSTKITITSVKKLKGK